MKEYFNLKKNPSMAFIFPAIAFIGAYFATFDIIWLAISTSFIALSTIKYTPPKK